MAATENRIRPIDPEKDRKAIGRIWREVGWIDDKEQEKVLDHFLKDSWGLVAEIHGEPEVSVTGHEGRTRYLDRELPMWGVTSVTVSRVARKQGLAGTLTAQLLAEGARRGCTIAMLGMFEQGFYDRLGFGTGSYERVLAFDPASLAVTGAPRPPHRIEQKHYKALHRGVLAAPQHHGSCWFEQSNTLRAEMAWTKNSFGLGYYSEDKSTITHHIWGEAKDEHGPYQIYWYSFRTDEELIELLRLIKSLGDQVHGIEMKEPPGIMLQDFINQPFKQRRQTRKGAFESRHSSAAYWQLRILDLESAIAACHGDTEIDFTLDLTDPVTAFLGDDVDWRGVGGVWSVHLGAESEAKPGAPQGAAGPAAGSRHVVETDVGSFSRLWFGSASARSLAMQGRLRADAETIAALDRYFRLPEPHPWWDF